MQTILLVIGIIAGLAMAIAGQLFSGFYQGFQIIGLVFISGVLSLFGYRRPWLMALAVSFGMILFYILEYHDLYCILLLPFPLLGAYVGWAVNTALRWAHGLSGPRRPRATRYQ
jgi:hypothetical protein